MSGLAEEEQEHEHEHEHGEHEHGENEHGENEHGEHEHGEHEHGENEHGEHEHGEHDEHEHGHEHHEHEHGHEHHEHEPEHEHAHGEASEAVDAMLEAIRQAKVEQLVVSSISTFASVAYGKLEAGDLPQARAAIDVIDALLPFLQGEEEAIRRDFEQALTNLKLAYANAVPPAE